MRGRVVIGVGLLLLAVLRLWVLAPLQIGSASMQPTLRPGEVVLWSPLAAVARGDLVVVEEPGAPGVLHVKRLVALGPAVVEGGRGELYVDGRRAAVEEQERAWWDEGCLEHSSQMLREEDHWVMPGGDMPREVLAAGEHWILGDNRAHSEDSRQWGPVGAEAVKGRVLTRIWSPGDCQGALK